MRAALLAVTLVALGASPAFAVSYSSLNVPRNIGPAAGTTTTSTLTIADTGTIADLDVTLNLQHQADGDLTVWLTSPQGTLVQLFSGVGGLDNNFSSTVLDDEAATSITAGSAPFNGVFKPQGLLSSFDGESITGTWTLTIADGANDNGGRLTQWSLALATTQLGSAAAVVPAPASLVLVCIGMALGWVLSRRARQVVPIPTRR